MQIRSVVRRQGIEESLAACVVSNGILPEGAHEEGWVSEMACIRVMSYKWVGGQGIASPLP